jgi:RNA polymerase sigma-70 factor (ECF subfamily)
VVLREIEGFAYEEIAEILQVNLGTVKSRLMRGRAALRAILAPTNNSPNSSLLRSRLNSRLEVSR